MKAITQIKWIKTALNGVVILAASLALFSCANQQPPGGGDEDKTPPKVTIVSPKPNSTNFRGNSLIFEFNEYIDRRSFQDAFRTSPQVKGDIEFSWGLKDVEVRFPKDLDKIDPNKTDNLPRISPNMPHKKPPTNIPHICQFISDKPTSLTIAGSVMPKLAKLFTRTTLNNIRS